MHFNLKKKNSLKAHTESSAPLLKSMGVSQPCAGSERTDAVQSTQRMTDFFLFFFFCCASYQGFFSPFLVCQGMTRVCSLSLLLAWKGISKLL